MLEKNLNLMIEKSIYFDQKVLQWTPEDDKILIEHVKTHGRDFRNISLAMKTRTLDSCRNRVNRIFIEM